ncbi:MAG TPA: NAD-dependent epimerase/dehydratase family protein, partial [Bacteroidia bacterium]|nr:NAD-dependent epimerase/dehydratase family protein [Bacteroidia bacterium]
GYHKLLSENLLLEYSKFFDLRTCSLRVFSAYGEGLKKQLFWDIHQKSLINGKIVLYGTGRESRDFIYISDLVNIVNLIIEKGSFSGEVYNIGNGEEVTIKEAAKTFLDRMGNGNNIEIVFSNENKVGDPTNWKADIQKIVTLGYQRSYTFKEGIDNYCKWLKELE